MQDIHNIVKNIEGIYDSNTAFSVLKDFERVLDELDIYVYEHWEDGELAEGPKISRHWVECSFMWPRKNMPNPMGGKRLLDYDCKVFYKKDSVIKPRKIRKPDDIRTGSKKGKLDKHPIWLVTIKMPKRLIADIYGGTKELESLRTDASGVPGETQPADASAAQPAPDAGLSATAPAPAPEAPTGAL